jgi:predicted MFS family arabinose efflux permease
MPTDYVVSDTAGHAMSSASEFRRGWKVVLASAVGVGVGVSGAAFYTIGVFMKPLAAEFHWTRAAVSAAALFLSLGWTLTAPIVGYMADRMDVRKLALISLIGMIAGLLALTRINGNIWSLYLGLTFLAVAGSGTAPLVWTHAVNSWFDRSRGLSLGLTLGGSGIAAILAPRWVDKLIQAYGWQGGYLGLAAFTGVVAFPIVFAFFRERKASDAGPAIAAKGALPGMSVGQAVASRRFWQLAVGIYFIVAAMAAILIHFVPFLTDAGLSRDAATGIAGLIGFAVLFTRVGLGYLVDRFHAPYVAGAVLLIPAAGYLLLAFNPTGGWTIAAAALSFGAAAGAEVDLLAYLASRFFGLRAFGGIYGLLLVPFGVAAGTGPILMGRVYDITGGYGPGLYAGALACVLAALMLGTLGRYPSAFAAHRPSAGDGGA